MVWYYRNGGLAQVLAGHPGHRATGAYRTMIKDGMTEWKKMTGINYDTGVYYRDKGIKSMVKA